MQQRKAKIGCNIFFVYQRNYTYVAKMTVSSLGALGSIFMKFKAIEWETQCSKVDLMGI